MLFEAELHQLEALAKRRPVLIIFEDAHWIDPTSRELLDVTVDRIKRLPVLLVVTFRPEFQHAWGGLPQVTMLTLNQLGGRDSAALVEGLAGNAGLSREIVNEIVDRADGVPLFVEELTKAVLESSDSDNRVAAVLAANPAPELAIPATLHASLVARLDRLGPLAKEVRQIGAVLGREFGYDLLEQVAQRPAVDLTAGLDQLAEAGLLFCRGLRRNPPIYSSMRWSRMPPMAPCCAQDGRNCTLVSRRHWSSVSPILSSGGPNSSPIISLPPATQGARSTSG
jgi:predicted ATPase